jgi:hypothetical protein
MRWRLLVPLLVAVPLAGCGSSAERTAAPVLPVTPKKHYVPVVPKTKLVRRAERLCRRYDDSRWLSHAPVYDPASPLVSLQRATAFARQYVVAARRGYRMIHALGVPRRGLARRRWLGFLSQYRATIDHLDELQAGVEVLDVYYARQSLRQLNKSVHKGVRRGKKLGLHACVT